MARPTRPRVRRLQNSNRKYTMRKHTRLVGLLFLAGVSALAGCRRASEPSALLGGQNVLLITLDTTRADRIGCYGNENAVTPAMDSLAERGILFERAYSQVPLTTPSHCSLLTGRYPREHGVRSNGHTALPEAFPTLATIFREKGYATGAFVAAFVLDHGFGLARGFDVYNDDMGDKIFREQRLEMELPGDVVTDRALAWLEETKDRPFFGWVHYYDPHAPFEPPPEFAAAAANPYDGEINFMDSQIKRLLDWLDANELTARTFIVVVGDHGEAFGEHGERGHGIFLYGPSIHVPLILAHPRLPSSGRRNAVVGVIDVFPTLLDLYGYEHPEGLLAESFAPLLGGDDAAPRASYAETLYGWEQFGWAEVRSLTLARWKYISTARPELYDLEADAREKNNLIDAQPEIAADMLALLKQRYSRMVPGQATAVALDEAQRRGLESLGYIASAAPPEIDEFLTPGLPDPKDRLDERERIRQARVMAGNGKHEDATKIYEEVLANSPNASGVHHSLAGCYMAMGRMQDARRSLERTIELSPTNWVALSGLGNVLVALREFEGAVKVLRAAEALSPDDPQIQGKLGVALNELGYTTEALEHLKRGVATAYPESAAVYEEAGTALRDRGMLPEAVKLYTQAFGRKPDDGQRQYALGDALIRVDQVDKALPFIEQALEADPELAPKLIQSGRERAGAGAVTEGKRYLQVAARFETLRGPANYLLGELAVKEGDNAAAVRHFEIATEMQPGNEQAVGALSKIHFANGDVADAIRVMDRAVEASPDSVLLLMSLAQVLSTARDEARRDGARALELANRAVELSERKNPAALLTLASAVAETGDFTRAVATAEEALELLGNEPKEQALARVIRTQATDFRAGRPYRNPQF
jgi:arylsulfatase A-like enzyme/Flp pilus assembly protein TadD